MELSCFLLDRAAFDAIAKNTGSLEEIGLRFMAYNGGIGMKHLTANNKKLRKVALFLSLNTQEDMLDDLEGYELSTDELEMTLDTVQIFSKCAELCELLLQGHDMGDSMDDEDLRWTKLPEIDDLLYTL